MALEQPTCTIHSNFTGLLDSISFFIISKTSGSSTGPEVFDKKQIVMSNNFLQYEFLVIIDRCMNMPYYKYENFIYSIRKLDMPVHGSPVCKINISSPVDLVQFAEREAVRFGLGS